MLELTPDQIEKAKARLAASELSPDSEEITLTPEQQQIVREAIEQIDKTLDEIAQFKYVPRRETPEEARQRELALEGLGVKQKTTIGVLALAGISFVVPPLALPGLVAAIGNAALACVPSEKVAEAKRKIEEKLEKHIEESEILAAIDYVKERFSK